MKAKLRIIARSFIGILLAVALISPSFAPLKVFAAEPEDSLTATYPYYAFVEDPDKPWDSVYDALDATDTIEYSDSYFDVPSPGDHPELRAVSYALALAGFENEADGYPSDSSTPNLKLTTFLDQLGFGNYQKWDTRSEANGHSMGTTIARKTLPNGQTLIVVAPRNYNYMTEWLSNFNVGTSGDHAGFTESAELIKQRLDEYISTNHLANYKIWMVGYSRGGAVIDLAAKMINENSSDYAMESDDFYVYTFGAPKASAVATNYDNIHDVKDGNDLILGYVFPELWGFYNTGTYEEIHPADLEITTSVVDITDLADSSRAISLLASNDGLTQAVGTMSGKDFMDEWFQFVTDSGLTREYFDAEIKDPLSRIMQLYQLKTLDKQDEFTNFLTSTNDGLAGIVAGNAFADLTSGNYPGSTLEEVLGNFPFYQNLVKILKGTATETDLDDFVSYLSVYMGDYTDYEAITRGNPVVSEAEFDVVKENAPKLVRALAPIIVADAKYTQDTYGDNYSLYYTYTLAANAQELVIGHIPESIMPILKSLIPAKDESETPAENPTETLPENTAEDASEDTPKDTSEDTPEATDAPADETPENTEASAPNAGVLTANGDRAFSTENRLPAIIVTLCATGTVVFALRRRLRG